MEAIFYKNISDVKPSEFVILGYLGKDRSRVEIIRKSQINNRSLDKIAGFWVNQSELSNIKIQIKNDTKGI